MKSQSRYPGAQPFESDQKDIFFGRQQDLVTLERKVKLAPLTVLYGKSGYGKSSLLNAGFMPTIAEEGQYRCVRVRFNAYQPSEDSLSPLETTQKAMALISSSNALQSIVNQDNSLWRLNKEFYIENQGQKGILFIFDQFEELFTYPAEDILEFRQQLAEALYTAAPQRYWDQLDQLYAQGNVPLSSTQLQLFQDNPNLKTVIAVRSDRMHLLEKLSDYIPLILKNLQELGPLDEEAARLAIVEPAMIKGNFGAPRFSYSPEALDQILSFLTDDQTEPVEATQLQIICHHLEQKIAASAAFEIVPEDVSNLAEVIENYYEERLRVIKDPQQVYAARRLIEEGLIFEEEERRLSIYEGQALKSFGLKKETLRSLVDSHLLRAEASLRGGYTYELSHDTLVPPILKAKTIRKSAEEKVAQEAASRKQQALLAKERAKRRRAYLLAGLGLLLAAVATTAAIIAYQQSQLAQRMQVEQSNQAFELAVLLAENYKVQGNYEAIDLLQRAINDAPTQQQAVIPSLEARLTKWQQIAQLVMQSDRLALTDSLGYAISLLTTADSIETDPFLSNKLENLIIKRDNLVERYRVLAEGQEGLVNQREYARQNYQKILLLDPTDTLAQKRLEALGN